MSDVLQGPFGAVAADGGNSGNSGNGIDAAASGLPGDAWLSGVAMDVLVHVSELLDGKGDEVARVLLLAAAEVLHDGPTAARPGPASDMLMQAVCEALDAFHAPPPSAPVTGLGEPLRVPASMVEPVRGWLKGFAPRSGSEGSTPPAPAAA